MANTYKSKYTETSAALNHNVDELLVGILTQIRLKLQTQVKVRFNLFPLIIVSEGHNGCCDNMSV